MPGNHNDIERRLWSAADQLRANSHLRSSEYSVPVLGLLFLRFADHKFAAAKERIEKETSGKRRTISKVDYQSEGILYLPKKSTPNKKAFPVMKLVRRYRP